MDITILGTGFMGKKHKSVLEHLDEVSTIYEVDNHHPSDQINYYPSLEAFLEAQPQSELVVVATPNHLHFQHSKKLLENGYNVLIEKPFCFHAEEAIVLQETAKANNAKVFLVMQNRFSPVSKLLKSLTDKSLGKIYNIQINAFWNRGKGYYKEDSWKGKKEMDGGILYTQFSHLVDLLTYFFNEKQEVMFKDLSSFRNYDISEIEDTAIVILKSENGAKTILNFSTAVFEKNQETSLNIIAEHGTIKISGQYFDEVVYQHISGLHQNFDIEKGSNEKNLTHMYEEIFKSLQHQENTAIVLEDGIPLVNLLEEIYS